MTLAHQYNLYDRLLALPENLTGEILNGQLHTQPRPSGPHARVEAMLGSSLIDPFDRGRGGPGGWWILIEPEVHFVLDTEVAVPDLAGWRRTRMPSIPRDHRFTVVPDWICEVLSPSTESKDRRIKMPLYARYGTGHLWLIDPDTHTLEAYALREKEWVLLGTFGGDEQVTVAPFAEVAISLADLWV